MIDVCDKVMYMIKAQTYFEGGHVVRHDGKVIESTKLQIILNQNTIRQAHDYVLETKDGDYVSYSKHLLDRTIFEFIIMPPY